MTNLHNHKLLLYLALMRIDRPIGTLLLLWPTLWALWLAGHGSPDTHLIIIFCLGTFLMRSAGCVVNDITDRAIDAHVKRTAQRPLATGKVNAYEARCLFVGLSLLAFVLVLFTNRLTILLAIAAWTVAMAYPLAKRYTYWAQLVLGAAFSFGIPMAFAAQSHALPLSLWVLYGANVLWTVVYDTFYAMVDRDDDRHLPVKSTALRFGHHDRLIIGLLQCGTLIMLGWAGLWFALGYPYAVALVGVGGLFMYQQVLIKDRDRSRCFQAFLNSQWVGALVFAGIVVQFAIIG